MLVYQFRHFPQSNVKIGEPGSLHCSHLSFKPQRKKQSPRVVSIAIVRQPVHINPAFSGPWSTSVAGGYSTNRRHNTPPNVPKKANNANTMAKIPNNELPLLPGSPPGPVMPCEPVGPEGPCTPWDPCGPEGLGGLGGPGEPGGAASPFSPTTKTKVAVAAVVA